MSTRHTLCPVSPPSLFLNSLQLKEVLILQLKVKRRKSVAELTVPAREAQDGWQQDQNAV